VAGNLGVQGIEVLNKDFAGRKAFLEASDGTINGIVVEPC
jgi:hypothetical protein